MRATTRLLLICLLIGQFYADLSNASPIDDSVGKEYQDDDFDYNEDYDSGTSEGPQAPLEVVPSQEPYFEETDIVVKAKPGSDVMLNCDCRYFGVGNVAMWYKGTTLLSTGQSALTDRVQIMQNNSMRLIQVRPEDADDYYCKVLPKIVTQHTKLEVAARLSILCDDHDCTDLSQTFRQGDHHKLDCQIHLENLTKIIWSLNGERLATANNGVIELDNVDEEHAGVYQCLGDDGSASPPHGMVSIDVQYSPKVSTHRHHVNAQKKGSAELYCDYRASPIGISFFIKDGKKLVLSEKYSIHNKLHKAHNRTTLHVKHIEESDLGEYLCHVENSVGSNEVKIQLGYNPETPQVESSSIEGNVVTVQWLVRSLQALTEAKMDYKLTGSHQWSTVDVINSDRHEDGIWKLTRQMELLPGLWHIHAKAKNIHGWSKLSPDLEIRIEDSRESVEVDDGAVPPDDLVRAGFGGGIGGKSDNNAACTLHMLPILMLTALSLCLRRL